MSFFKNILWATFAAAALGACQQKSEEDIKKEVGRVGIDTIIKPVAPVDTVKLDTLSKTPHIPAAKVSFHAVRDTAGLVRQYPFLDSLVTELYQDAEDAAGTGNDSLQISDNPLRVDISTSVIPLDDKKGGASLLFVRTEGSLYAGSEGAPVNIYMNAGDGKGYKPALTVTTFDDIKVDRGQPPKLIVGTGDGQAVWIFNKATGSFETQKPAGGAKPANPGM